MISVIQRNFLWVVVIFSVVALIEPATFIWLKPYISVFLGIIMLGVGLTLNNNDVRTTWDNKWIAITVIVVKYLFMPLLAYGIGLLLHLPLLELVGLVILGSCPGGTSANVMSFLSKGNTALTVVMTFGTTIIAPLITPTLVYLFLHKHIHVPFWGMFKSVMLIVFIPIIVGMLIKHIFNKKITKVAGIFPVISIFSIALVIGCVVGLNQHTVFSFPAYTLLAVTVLNLVGYLMGFLVALLTRRMQKERNAIVFELGMFDSGLGVVLATSFFAPLAALPAVIFSILQNVTGAILVKFYTRKISAPHADISRQQDERQSI